MPPSSLRGAKQRSNPEEKIMNEHVSYVYIMFNFRNGTLYTGVTNNLIRMQSNGKNK